VSLTFFVPGKPQPAGSKRAFHNKHTGRSMVVDANANSKPWQAAVAAAGHEAMNGGSLFTGGLHVELCFETVRPKGHYGSGRNAEVLKVSAPVHPTGRPDVLKLGRGVEDALTGVVWRDDAQIVYEVLRKRYAEVAGVYVSVLPLEGGRAA
jgi:Holliday junction resolvase RusA-like endonuclease